MIPGNGSRIRFRRDYIRGVRGLAPARVLAPWESFPRRYHELAIRQDKRAIYMKLERAVALLERTMKVMDKGFRMPLFDEWCICEAAGELGRILHYSGPRSEILQRQILRDIQPLAAELQAGQYDPGHFYFSHEGEGALYDAFMCIGVGLYVVFNNTAKSMIEITADPLWKDVQGHFVDLGGRFRVDPLA